MVALRDDDDGFRAEDLPGAVDAFIGGKPGVIEKHVIRVHAAFDDIIPHGAHFVVIRAAVVAAHEQPVGDAALIQRDRIVQAVGENRARAAVAPEAGAQHEDAVHVERGRLLRREDAVAHGGDHVQIDGGHRAGAKQQQRREHEQQAAQRPFSCRDPSFHASIVARRPGPVNGAAEMFTL